MTVSKFIRKLLKLKDVIVARFEFRVRNREFHLWVKPLKNGALCPECRRRGRIIRTMDHRLWQDVPICGWSVLFHYRPREIMCRRHGRVQELIPWADAYARVTYRFEYVMLLYCQLMEGRLPQHVVTVTKRPTFVSTRLRPLTLPSPPSMGERVKVRRSEPSILFRDD